MLFAFLPTLVLSDGPLFSLVLVIVSVVAFRFRNPAAAADLRARVTIKPFFAGTVEGAPAGGPEYVCGGGVVALSDKPGVISWVTVPADTVAPGNKAGVLLGFVGVLSAALSTTVADVVRGGGKGAREEIWSG